MNENMNEERELLLAEKRCLKSELDNSDDWGDKKISKYQEYIAAGLEAPFDMQEFHTVRQAKRDRINEIEARLLELDEIKD